MLNIVIIIFVYYWITFKYIDKTKIKIEVGLWLKLYQYFTYLMALKVQSFIVNFEPLKKIE